MTVQISGKNIEIGDSLRTSIDDRLKDAIEKYFGGGFSGHVVVSKEANEFRSECRLHLDTGIILNSHGEASDAYQSFDKSAERLEKRLRRYNRRLRDHHARDIADEGFSAADYTISASEEEDESAGVDDNPVIVAEGRTALKRMTVSMAVMAMDLADQPVMMFTNIANDRLNLVYRRKDGHIGWIDPENSGDQ